MLHRIFRMVVIHLTLPPVYYWAAEHTGFVIFVESCGNEIGITLINSKKFANLQLMTLTIMSHPHFSSPCYDNGNVNEQNSTFNSSSRQLKLMDFNQGNLCQKHDYN